MVAVSRNKTQFCTRFDLFYFLGTRFDLFFSLQFRFYAQNLICKKSTDSLSYFSPNFKFCTSFDL